MFAYEKALSDSDHSFVGMYRKVVREGSSRGVDGVADAARVRVVAVEGGHR